MAFKLVFFDTGIKKVGGVSYSSKKELASKIFSNENEFWKCFSEGDYFFAHNYFSYDIQNITKIQQEDKKIVDTLYLHTLFCIDQQDHNIKKN